MKRIARWSTIFLLLCSIIWAGTASATMIVENNMSALNTLNTINKNQTPQGKDSALERLAKEIGAGMWDNTDLDAPAFQENIKQFGITVLKKDTQPPESFIGDAIFDHLGDTEFNAPEMNGNLLVLGGLNANLPSGKIDRLYVLSDEDIRLNIGAAADVQELILGASGNVSLNGEGNVRSTIVVDKPMNLDIGIATNLVNLTDDPLPTGDIVLNPGKNALVPGQQLHMGSELKVEKKISLTVRFRLVDQSAKDMQLETADWDGALLTETTVQYTGDSCPMGAVNMMAASDAGELAQEYEFTVASAPDEVVGKIANSEADIAAISTNLAAKLYAKTEGGVTVLGVNTLGVLSMLEKEKTVSSVADLAGKTIYTTGQGANPQ